MGQSTDAYLVYGINISDEDKMPWKTYDPETYEDHFEDFEDWWAKQQPEGELDVEEPEDIEMVWHYSSDYPMWILAVPGTQKTAWRGSPVSITEPDLLVDPDKRQKLIDFCEKYKIKYEAGQLGWWLCSYWG